MKKFKRTRIMEITYGFYFGIIRVLSYYRYHG